MEQKEIPAPDAPEEIVLEEKDFADFEAEVERRRAAADTIAVNHDSLALIIPDSMPGYIKDVDKATTFETKRFVFSEAIRVFYDDNEDYLEFIVGDYVADPDFFQANIQRYNEAKGEIIDGVQEKKIAAGVHRPAGATDFFAWSLYNEEKQMARVYLGVNYRFFVTVEASGQSGHLDINSFHTSFVSVFH